MLTNDSRYCCKWILDVLLSSPLNLFAIVLHNTRENYSLHIQNCDLEKMQFQYGNLQ
jgi:hypothetical protein